MSTTRGASGCPPRPGSASSRRLLPNAAARNAVLIRARSGIITAVWSVSWSRMNPYSHHGDKRGHGCPRMCRFRSVGRQTSRARAFGAAIWLLISRFQPRIAELANSVRRAVGSFPTGAGCPQGSRNSKGAVHPETPPPDNAPSSDLGSFLDGKRPGCERGSESEPVFRIPSQGRILPTENPPPAV